MSAVDTLTGMADHDTTPTDADRDGGASPVEPIRIVLADDHAVVRSGLRMVLDSEIGERLFLSVRTVETHRSHIQQKLMLSTRSELVGYALERGLISTGGESGG
jgi:hypothetical protein